MSTEWVFIAAVAAANAVVYVDSGCLKLLFPNLLLEALVKLMLLFSVTPFKRHSNCLHAPSEPHNVVNSPGCSDSIPFEMLIVFTLVT